MKNKKGRFIYLVQNLWSMEQNQNLCWQKLSYFTGLLSTISSFSSLHVLSTSFLWHCQQTFFFHIFPAIHWILTFHPHFRNTDLSSGQWQHRLSLWCYRRRLFTLALKPKFCKFYSPGVGSLSSLYRQGKGLTGVRQLASARWLNQEDMESRIWTHY